MGSATNGGVAADATAPDPLEEEVADSDPRALDQEAPGEFIAFDPAEPDGDREVEEVGVRGEEDDLFEPAGEDIEGKQVTAGDVFEGELDEDEGGDIEDPEGEEGHHAGDDELEEAGEDDGDGKGEEGERGGGQGEVFAEEEEEEPDGDEGHDGVDGAAGKVEGEAVGEVTDGTDQELADVTVLDVRGDLPVVFGDGSEGVDEGDDQVVADHLGQGVTGDVSAIGLPGVDGFPEVEGAGEGDEAGGGPEQEVHPVHEGVLDPDQENVEVLAHAAGRGPSARSGVDSNAEVDGWRLMGRFRLDSGRRRV